MASRRQRDGTSRREEARPPVVDLTDDVVGEREQLPNLLTHRLGNARRGPRFANAIIDVEDEEEEEEEDDSGITFLSSHRLPPRVSGNRTPAPQSRFRLVPNANSIDVEGFEITGTNIIQQSSNFGINNIDDINTFQGSFTGITHTIQTLMSNMSSFLSPAMDYTQVAFDYIDRRSTSTPPSPPPYQAPPPAPAGFTRSPNADDVYVCANCEDELFEGDDEIKCQVWVVRNCGHVYCGECTTNRFITKAKKSRKPNAKTFKQCVVDGCTSKTSGSKAMAQLFI